MDATDLNPSDRRLGRLVRIFSVLALGAAAGALVGLVAGALWQQQFGYAGHRNPLTGLTSVLAFGMRPGAVVGLVIAAAFYRFSVLRRMAVSVAGRVERVLLAAFGDRNPSAVSTSTGR